MRERILAILITIIVLVIACNHQKSETVGYIKTITNKIQDVAFDEFITDELVANIVHKAFVYECELCDTIVVTSKKELSAHDISYNARNELFKSLLPWKGKKYRYVTYGSWGYYDPNSPKDTSYLYWFRQANVDPTFASYLYNFRNIAINSARNYFKNPEVLERVYFLKKDIIIANIKKYDKGKAKDNIWKIKKSFKYFINNPLMKDVDYEKYDYYTLNFANRRYKEGGLALVREYVKVIDNLYRAIE